MQAPSISRNGQIASDSPMIGKKPRESSMVLNTDIDEDEDYYEEDEDDAREFGKKQDGGNYNLL